ncbi:RE1, partial [Symbiodinium microadriaticum]
MVVSVPDGGNKRQRVAAVGQDSGDKGNGKGPKGGKTGEAGGQQGAGTGRGGKGDPVKLCSAWSTDAGCPNGKQCSLKHAPERPGGCWVCGGMHQKAECKAPGGGKASKDGDTGEDGGTKGKKGKPKGGEAKPPKTNVGQNPKGQPKGQASTTNVSEAAIREAAQILQSLRLASVKSDLQSATKILSKVGENGNRGLIDGGATSCMRTALPDEYNLPKIPVKLACGSCDMFINEHGTLLSQISVSPIISMKALLKLGYRMDWNATRCRVFHSKFGDLEVDTSSGCPEVDEGVALDLIREYELYVGRQDQRVARLQSIIADLRDRGTGELLELIRRAFENIAHRWDFAHLSVDVAEDLLCDSTYKFLLQQDELRKDGVEAKYLVVGVLSVPVLAVEGLKVDEPADADPVPVPLEGGVFDDAEWLMDDASKVEEKDDDLTAKELSDARASWNEWDKLVKSSRDDWIQDAQSEVLPRVEIVDFVYVEAIERKSHQEVAEPMHPADKLAQVLYKADRFQPKDLAELAVEADRQLLWETGFTLLPATRDEYWGYGIVCSSLVLDRLSDDSEQFELYGVDWPMHADVSRAIDCLARQHHELRALLQGLEEGQEAATSRCDQLYWDALKGLERHGNELREVEDRLLKTACPAVLRSLSVAEEVNPEEFEEPVQERPSEPTLTDESDPPPLQTKIIGADQVRREPEKWIPSMTEEYHSLVSRTGAVQELSDGQYQQLLGDQGVTLEIIPGKLVYVHKPSGRRKSRIVGCGNYCQGGSSERNELYASGAGAESLRLMIRRCALQPDWVLGSVDVRTAFLQAPLLEQQRDGRRLVTIVRVPSILRETGVTTCRFWKVQKALYGLASAPRSWSNYRDKVLAGLRIPCEGGELRLSKMLEDANLLHIVKFPKESGGEDPTEGQRVGVIALYVDDVLIGAVRPICEAVIKALQDQWELSPPEWLATTGDQMKFAGYELQKTSEGIRLHQESYVQDLLEQNEDLIMGEERAPAVKMGVFEDTVDDAERRELTKRSQGLIGQLLWLAGRTRPDLAYAVSMAAQKIAASPREAVARAEHLVRYLRGAPGVSLHYKIADGNCGKWGQLRHQQTSTTLDVYTDASFAADEQCRSFGSVHLYWGGALVSWASARQTLIAAHTAESELYSLAEGHLMGKAFRPTVAALVNVSEHDLACHLYCDNAAAVQLCTLESGLEDLLKVCDLWMRAQHLVIWTGSVTAVTLAASVTGVQGRAQNFEDVSEGVQVHQSSGAYVGFAWNQECYHLERTRSSTFGSYADVAD